MAETAIIKLAAVLALLITVRRQTKQFSHLCNYSHKTYVHIHNETVLTLFRVFHLTHYVCPAYYSHGLRVNSTRGQLDTCIELTRVSS